MFLEILIFSALAILIGFAFTFTGYRFFRFLLPVWGFLVGLMFGVGALDALFGGGFLSTALGIIVGFVIGIILALLAYFVYSLAVVIFGASVGFALGQGLLLLIGLEPGLITWLGGILLAIVFVVLFIALRMPTLTVVVSTASAGSMALITGLFILFGKVPPELASIRVTEVLIEDSILWIGIWLVVAIFGIATQYATERNVNMMKAYQWETAVDDAQNAQAQMENESKEEVTNLEKNNS